MSTRSLQTRRSRPLGVLFALVVANCVVGAGCGNDSPSPRGPSALSAGTRNVDLSQVEGWQDASVPEGLSDTEACVRFQRATCERKQECGLDTPECDSLLKHCPDVLFSPGSTWDAQSAWECAFELRQRSCEDVYLNRLPSCYRAGTKKVGDDCVGPAQCQSLACSAGMGDSCGQCLPRLGKDQPCASADGVQIAACEAGLKCQAASLKCSEPPARSFAILDAGTECDVANDACGPGLYCKTGATVGLGTCTQRLPEDSECSESRACANGLYCFQLGMRCIPVPETGKKCGADIETGNYIWCKDDAYCDNQTWECKPLPAAGEPCAETLFSAGKNVCAASAKCDVNMDPPLCQPLLGLGEACTQQQDCQAGLSCTCDPKGATANDADCPKLCSVIRDFGGGCASQGELCNSAATCLGGVCQPNQSSNLYADRCGS